MREIQLTRGRVAIVDDVDFEMVSAFRWHAQRTRWGDRATCAAYPFKAVYLSRALVGAKPGEVVDHVNGDTLDNRRENLRIVTTRQNAHNMRRSKNSKAGMYKGVQWRADRQKWRARIGITRDGRLVQFHLGSFNHPEEAALAYDAAARELFGEFAACNYPYEG